MSRSCNIRLNVSLHGLKVGFKNASRILILASLGIETGTPLYRIHYSKATGFQVIEFKVYYKTVRNMLKCSNFNLGGAFNPLRLRQFAYYRPVGCYSAAFDLYTTGDNIRNDLARFKRLVSKRTGEDLQSVVPRFKRYVNIFND